MSALSEVLSIVNVSLFTLLRPMNHFRFFNLWNYGPDWRFQTARTVVDRGRDANPAKSPVIGAIADVLRHEELGDGIDHLNPRWLDAFTKARDIFLDPQQRIHLEALILAGCTTACIAQRVGHADTTVAEFERCFFALRRFLGARDLVVSLIERTWQCAEPLQVLVRKQAFLGGPTVAEHWLEHLPHLGKGIEHNLDTAEGREREMLELLLLQEQIDFSKVPHRVLLELHRASQPRQSMPTVSDLVRDQISHAVKLSNGSQSKGATMTFLEPFHRPDTVQHTA